MYFKSWKNEYLLYSKKKGEKHLISYSEIRSDCLCFHTGCLSWMMSSISWFILYRWRKKIHFLSMLSLQCPFQSLNQPLLWEHQFKKKKILKTGKITVWSLAQSSYTNTIHYFAAQYTNIHTQRTQSESRTSK